MSIRINGKLIASVGGGGSGSGSNILVDEQTIVNENSMVTTVGMKSKSGDVIHDWVGTLAEYNAGVEDGSIKDNWVCWVTDDNGEYDPAPATGFNIFDTKIADHILEGEEAIGWALQGTYVDGKTYPHFYNKCLEEKTTAQENEVTLGESVLTMFVNDNGHQFFNIADKSIVDIFYEAYGIADFYGIDEENERVFLPRNKYFHQLTDDPSKINKMMEAGLPNITGEMGGTVTLGVTQSGALYKSSSSAGMYGNLSATEGFTSNYSFDASNSNPIYGNSNTVQPPSSLKLLYYCVGNTNVEIAYSDITELTSTENDTIPLFTGMYFDFKPNNASWLKAGEQQNSGGIYRGCYNELIKIINGINPYNLQIIEEKNMEADVDYSLYWILNQDNLTFRTPLTIATKSLSGGVAGNGMSLGITDGNKNSGIVDADTGVLMPRLDIYGKNIGTQSASADGFLYTYKGLGITTDPTKSGIIAEQSTAQLYFKVANAVQNLELLDAGEVLEGLADKLDTNASNIAAEGKSLISGFGMPSDNYIDLTLGANGTNYTAPANGYFYLAKAADSWQTVGLIRRSNIPTWTDLTSYLTAYGGSGNVLAVWLPVKKGDVVGASYNATGATHAFRFFYAEGEQ